MIIPNFKIGSENKNNLILQSGEKIKYLYRATAIANYSYHDEATGADYQVPAGKKFTALTFYKAYAAYAGIGFFSGPNVNSLVGATLIGYTGLPQNIYSMVENMVWTAGNYITTDAGANGDRFIGVESDV